MYNESLKPQDASDIDSFEEGKKEVQRLRQLLREHDAKQLTADSSAASLSQLEVRLPSPRHRTRTPGGMLRRGSKKANNLGLVDILMRRARGGHLAQDYIATVQANQDMVSCLENVLLLPVDAVLEAGKLLSFAEAAKHHVQAGTVVGTSERILFVSHRWYSLDHPDPLNLAYAMLVSFLKKRGRRLKWVWLDYSCLDNKRAVQQTGSLGMIDGTAVSPAKSPVGSNRNTEAFPSGKPNLERRRTMSYNINLGLHNLPVALLMATDVLMIPRIAHHEAWWVSDLEEFTGRGWAQVEALLCILTGTDATVALHASQAGPGGENPSLETVANPNSTFFARADWGADGGKTFLLAGERAAKGMADCSEETKTRWSKIVKEPKDTLALFSEALAQVQNDPLLQLRVFSGRVHEGDLMSRPAVLTACRDVGLFGRESDRLAALRCSLAALLVLASATTSQDPSKTSGQTQPAEDLKCIGEEALLEEIKDGGA